MAVRLAARFMLVTGALAEGPALAAMYLAIFDLED
jgi:hypothetical protein